MAAARGVVGRPASLSVPRNDLAQVLGESRRLYQLAAPIAARGQRTRPGSFAGAPARQVIGLAFMRMVGAWEQFLEDVFLRYLVGVTVAGNQPVLVQGRFATIEAAFADLCANPAATRDTQFLSWNHWKDIRRRARVYFQPGDPFTTTLTGANTPGAAGQVATTCMDRAIDIRNRVAHPSRSAKAKFKTAALAFGAGNARGTLPKAFMVADLLTMTCRHFPAAYQGQTFFLGYAALIDDLASRVAP